MGSELDKANRIIRTSTTCGQSHGELIVYTLLHGRSIDQLGIEELQALAKGYNWWTKNKEASEVIKTAIELQPNDLNLLREAIVYLRNACVDDLDSLQEVYQNFLDRQLGPAWFWRINKASQYIFVATGEAELQDYEWQLGHEILHPKVLEQAISKLILAIKDSPSQGLGEIRKFVDERPALQRSPQYESLQTKLNTMN